jgi:FtsP/CotA-like multicopper oxidase with cupredoxin domain
MHRRDLLKILGLSAMSAATGRVYAGDGRRAAPTFTPDVEFTLMAAPGEVSILPGAPTRVWRFTGQLITGPAGSLQVMPGSYLGPVLRLRRGQKVRVRFQNRLPEPSIVHWHGLDVPEAADGHPRLAVAPGRDYIYEFEVANRAGTYWYHPHPHMRTGAQVYHGLAGLLIVGDEEEDRLALPAAEAEHLCVLQDRQVDAANQLVFRGDNMMEMMNGFLGDRVLVSGRPRPMQEVDAGWHRVRLLNGSNARIYKLAWSRDVKMTLIGGDGGLFEQPVPQSVLTLAPGQRADLLIDLTGITPGTDIHFDSQAYPEADAGIVGMMGMGGGMGMGRGRGAAASAANGAAMRVMTLRVRARKGVAFKMPPRLSTFDASWATVAGAKIRQVPIVFQRMQWLLGGRTFEMTQVAPEETVTAGSTQVWEFMNLANGMGMEAAHPIHMHGRQFRVLERRGGRAGNTLRAGVADAGWRDVVLVLPGETVRVQATFSHHPGLYLYHCHILEHEDMGMMRNFRIR